METKTIEMLFNEQIEQGQRVIGQHRKGWIKHLVKRCNYKMSWGVLYTTINLHDLRNVKSSVHVKSLKKLYEYIKPTFQNMHLGVHDDKYSIFIPFEKQ
jgi:hypothetical protein